MRIEVTTTTGSVYVIDDDAKTWKRVSKTSRSGPCRTEEGTFIQRSELKEGEGLTLVCEPLASWASARVIYTSNVVSWKEEGYIHVGNEAD